MGRTFEPDKRILGDDRMEQDQDKISKDAYRKNLAGYNKDHPYKKSHVIWKQSMYAKIDYQNQLMEEAKRCQRDRSYKPKIQIGKKNKHLFERYLEIAKKQEENRLKREQRNKERRR